MKGMNELDEPKWIQLKTRMEDFKCLLLFFLLLFFIQTDLIVLSCIDKILLIINV